jgi:hypothetical protein
MLGFGLPCVFYLKFGRLIAISIRYAVLIAIKIAHQ